MARSAPAIPHRPAGPLGPPPVPREHGAWVMLLTPLLAGVITAAPIDPIGAVALLVAAIAAFLAQNAAAIALRPRPPQAIRAWLGVYALVLAVAGAALMLGPGRLALIALALPGAVLFTLHARLQGGPAGVRLDRTAWGQAVTAAVLTLSGPAAWAVARGTLGAEALVLWGTFLAAFLSGILHVNMRLAAVKVRSTFDRATRWDLGREVAVYHAGLAVAALGLVFAHPAGWLLAAGLAPYAVRGLLAVARLAPGVPSFKRIGLVETAFAFWLTGWLVAALAGAGP